MMNLKGIYPEPSNKIFIPAYGSHCMKLRLGIDWIPVTSTVTDQQAIDALKKARVSFKYIGPGEYLIDIFDHELAILALHVAADREYALKQLAYGRKNLPDQVRELNTMQDLIEEIHGVTVPREIAR